MKLDKQLPPKTAHAHPESIVGGIVLVLLNSIVVCFLGSNDFLRLGLQLSISREVSEDIYNQS